MSRSKPIRVIKRDGTVEPFDETKLAASMWAAMDGVEGEYEDARELARAVGCYLHRIEWPCVASAAVFEMALKILRRVQFRRAASVFETRRQRRKACRKRIRVIHDGGQITAWDKSWLVKLAARVWHVTDRTGRIVAGQLEQELLDEEVRWIRRGDLVDRLNDHMLDFGLADAVPVEPPAAQA